MKQLKSRAMLLSLVVIIFATSTTNTFSQLTKIWDRSNENFKLERLCAPGKLAVVSKNGINQQLIDLTNGETIYSSTNGIYTNYWGDRFYVHESGNLNEYDVKTKEFIKVVPGFAETVDSVMSGFNYTNHSLLFYNANTRQLLDSFKIPNTDDQPEYTTLAGSRFSNDGRFFTIYLQKMFNPTGIIFLLYDRQAREIILEKGIPLGGRLISSFFNIKNHFAYVENIQLPEDDKAYSYIRIYDPEKRMVIKNLKLFDDDVHYPSFITFRQDDQIFAYGNGTNNDILFFDFENDRKIEFTIPTFPGPLYLDDSLYIAGSYRGYKIDWNVVSVAEDPKPEIPTLYPNPTTSMINLNVSENLYNGQWQISDLTGNVLLQGLILPNPQLQINIGTLPAQNYFLRLQKDNFNLMYNIIKY